MLKKLLQFLLDIQKSTDQAIGYIEAILDAHNGDRISASAKSIEEGQLMRYKGHTIYQRKDRNRWEVKIPYNGKRKSIYGATQKECLENMRKALKDPHFFEKPKTSYTLFAWIEYYLKTYRAERKSKENDSTLNKLKKLTKDLPLNSVVPNRIQEWLNATADTPRARQSLYSLLNSSLNMAAANGLISSSPTTAIEKPKHKQKEGKPLSPADEKVFFNAIRGHKYESLYKVILFGGMRRSEALNLKDSDVDLDNKRLHVPGTKTDGSDRFIPLFDRLKDSLPDPLPVGKLYNYNKDTVSKEFKKLMPKYSIKDLRTTFATRAMEKGIPPEYIAKWLGHTSVSTTNKHYIKANNDEYENKLISIINDRKRDDNSDDNFDDTH